MESLESPLRSGPYTDADLPELDLKDAAWLAGVTPDAMARFLKSAGLDIDTEDPEEAQLTVPELLKAVFLLLGQKENRIAMLRIQLAAALNREKELAAALQSGLTDDSPALEPEPDPIMLSNPLDDDDDDEDDEDEEEPIILKKKKKKKKKKSADSYRW
uniref:Uncharacterized protein n=1 Tax=Magnetococcus massalia (strain MO-1) TaxID=451514 RepID=A0A1S7LQQ8_MAGMO|nr:Conserved protein of unknown function [Candidatus Magnetococcus massalia]